MNSKPPDGPPTALVTLLTDAQAARNIAGLVAETFDGDEVAVSFVDTGHGQWRVAIHCRGKPDRKALQLLVAAAAGPQAAAALVFEHIAAKDWVAESLAGLKPVAAGRFVVHGAHDRAAVPPSRIGIEIEAALAFGTGHHGTTRGCLLALDGICKSVSAGRAVPHILDLGTGSGVLAIAAARALHRPVLATDIDGSAVRVARDNARLNRIAPMIEFVQASGLTAPAIRARAPYDLVFANILLGPLQRLAAPLTRIVAPRGHLVLSGLLSAQANAALAAYRDLALEHRIVLDGWTTLVLKRSSFRSMAVAPRRREP